MKLICLLTLITLFKTEILAQVAQPLGKLDVNTAPGGIIEEVAFDKIPERKGSQYLNENWVLSNIFLKSGKKIENKPLKYDLQIQVIRIKFDRVVKALKASKILRFELINSDRSRVFFINAGLFDDELPGFFRVVQEGSMRLFSTTKLQLVKANYVPTHDVGKMSDEYLKTELFYFEKNMMVFKVPKNKNKAMKFFGAQAENVKTFVRKNSLGFKREQDLIQIIKFYNSLN